MLNWLSCQVLCHMYLIPAGCHRPPAFCKTTACSAGESWWLVPCTGWYLPSLSGISCSCSRRGNALGDESVRSRQLLCALALFPRKVSATPVCSVWRARGCSSPLSASPSVRVMAEAAAMAVNLGQCRCRASISSASLSQTLVCVTREVFQGWG